MTTQRITNAAQAMEFLEQCGFKLTERVPWGMADSQQIMDLFTEAARGVFVPNAWTTNEAWARYHHQDVEGLTETELWREVERAKFLLVWHERPGEWVTERLRACQAEQAQRAKKAKAQALPERHAK